MRDVVLEVAVLEYSVADCCVDGYSIGGCGIRGYFGRKGYVKNVM